MLRLASFLAVAVILTISQVGLVSLLPFPLSAINLALTALLFILFVFHFSDALWLGLVVGILLELFALAPFGLLSASLLLTLVIAHWLFSYLFTNRSLPSLLALGLAGTLIFRLIFLTLNLLLMLKFQTNFSFTFGDYGLITLWEMAANSLLLILAFSLMNQFSKKLKTVFLMR